MRFDKKTDILFNYTKKVFYAQELYFSQIVLHIQIGDFMIELFIGISSIFFTCLPTMIPFVFFFVFIYAIIKKVNNVRRTASDIATTVWGTDDIKELVNQNDMEIRETPKSVSAMTSIYLPTLQRDFPDLNWDEFKHNAVTELKKHLSKSYDSFKIHRTELYRYVKNSGTCTVIFQSSVEYMLGGLKTQTRFNTHMVYIQNADLSDGATAFSTTCPNCGAPIATLGAMKCEYCDSSITPINVKVWDLLKVEEIQ